MSFFTLCFSQSKNLAHIFQKEDFLCIYQLQSKGFTQNFIKNVYVLVKWWFFQIKFSIISK